MANRRFQHQTQANLTTATDVQTGDVHFIHGDGGALMEYDSSQSEYQATFAVQQTGTGSGALIRHLPVLTCDVVANLRYLKPRDKQLVYVYGWHAVGSGGQLLRYDSSSSATIDGVFVFSGRGGDTWTQVTAGSSNGTGRYHAVEQEYTTSARAGARAANTMTQNTTQLQAAFDAALVVIIEDEILEMSGLGYRTGQWIIGRTPKATLKLNYVGEAPTEHQQMLYPKDWKTGPTDDVRIDDLTLDGNRGNWTEPSGWTASTNGTAHGLAVWGVRRFRSRGVTVKNTRTDGFYIHGTHSTAATPANAEDVVVTDYVIDNVYRNGISVISGKRGVIAGGTIKNVTGVSPKAGVDFEANPETRQFFTADAGTDTFTATSHGYADGYVVRVASSGALPSPLSAATDYYVVNKTTNTFQLSTTSGGGAIDVLDAGTGNHQVHRKLHVIDDWVLSDTLIDSCGNGVHCSNVSGLAGGNYTFSNITVQNHSSLYGFLLGHATNVQASNLRVESPDPDATWAFEVERDAVVHVNGLRISEAESAIRVVGQAATAITSSTAANPVVLTVPAGNAYVVGHRVFISGVSVQTELNDKFHLVTAVSDTTITLATDGSAHAGAGTGGMAQLGPQLFISDLDIWRLNPLGLTGGDNGRAIFMKDAPAARLRVHGARIDHNSKGVTLIQTDSSGERPELRDIRLYGDRTSSTYHFDALTDTLVEGSRTDPGSTQVARDIAKANSQSTKTFTADAGTDTFTATGHGYDVNNVVRVSSDTALPTGLSAATDYYVVNITANTFQLASIRSGAPVSISDAGTGTHSVFQRWYYLHGEDNSWQRWTKHTTGTFNLRRHDRVRLTGGSITIFDEAMWDGNEVRILNDTGSQITVGVAETVTISGTATIEDGEIGVFYSDGTDFRRLTVT